MRTCSGIIPFKNSKLKYTVCADYASSATFVKSANIVLVSTNYANNYAGTILINRSPVELCEYEVWSIVCKWIWFLPRP